MLYTPKINFFKYLIIKNYKKYRNINISFFSFHKLNNLYCLTADGLVTITNKLK